MFVGGFTLGAVVAFADRGLDDVDPLEAISSLVGQSVVFVRLQDESNPRYGMLETIREFALEQLDASGEAAEARRRHAEVVLDLAEWAEPMLLVPAERSHWMAQLEDARENVRVALTWSVSARRRVRGRRRPGGRARLVLARVGPLRRGWVLVPRAPGAAG